MFKSKFMSLLRGAGIALGLSCTLTITATQAWANAYLIQTNKGPVQGFLTNGIAEFLGIPYAAPPLGNLRWRPPQAHQAWTNVLQAKAFGPECAQIQLLGVFAGPANNNEDCLYLNIFSPNVSSKANLPVIFWIHGGGNIDGASNGYDGTKLATQGHVVVVTINYRLGLLGWLANPALDAEGHLFGNYGLLDQQFAIKWVKQNIRAFGGNPNNITVGGQSAGSLDTQANMVSPQVSAGFFQHAIFESGVQEPAPLDFAEQHGTAFALAAGCGAGATPAVAKCLRNLTAAQIMNLQNTGNYATQNGVIGDGQVLPPSFADAYKSGNFLQIPVISGMTHDEGAFGLAVTEYSENPRVPFSATDYDNIVMSTFSGNAGPAGSPPPYPAGTPKKVMQLYPLASYPTPQLALTAIETDGAVFFECPQRQINRLIAAKVPLYAYRFDDQTAPFYFPKMPGFVSLAYHTADIQYLFPLWHGGPQGIPHPLNKAQTQLSDELVAAWTNFAWTGNPNGQGNSPWPRYQLGATNSYWLSENIPQLSLITDAQFYNTHKCSFWDTVTNY
ncbi:MAG TPA: carboxylesterase family protein [Methylovirgula sp.]|nr:carboxylesterase family protein [Methylovirgula sp.]